MYQINCIMIREDALFCQFVNASWESWGRRVIDECDRQARYIRDGISTSHYVKVFTSVIDLFSGTSRVGHALKREGYQVFSNDHNAYAHTLAACYVEADREDIESDALRLIAEFNAGELSEQELRFAVRDLIKTFPDALPGIDADMFLDDILEGTLGPRGAGRIKLRNRGAAAVVGVPRGSGKIRRE